MPPDFSGLSEEELIAMLSQLGQQGNGLPGKTPANQLNYYQDLVSTLGFDPVQQSGLGADGGAPPTPEYVTPVNKQRFTYDSDPLYKQMFDLIDSGASPASAVTAAGIKDPDAAKEAQKVAVDYAGSVADEMNARQKFDQTNEKATAKYTAPDGSKYKNAPLGGNDIYGSASEFDLLGQPTTDDLMAQLSNVRGLEQKAQFVDAGPQSRSAPATYTTPGRPGVAGTTRQMGDVDAGDLSFATPNERAYAQSMQKNSPTYTTGASKGVPATSNSGNGPERSWEAPSLQATGRSTVGGGSLQDQAAYRQALRARQNQAKNTQVRSDANTNAMRRVLALRTVLGG